MCACSEYAHFNFCCGYAFVFFKHFFSFSFYLSTLSSRLWDIAWTTAFAWMVRYDTLHAFYAIYKRQLDILCMHTWTRRIRMVLKSSVAYTKSFTVIFQPKDKEFSLNIYYFVKKKRNTKELHKNYVYAKAE